MKYDYLSLLIFIGLGLVYLVYKCCRDGLCNWKRLRESHLPHPSYRPVESISSRTTSRFTAGGRDLMLVTNHRLSLSVYDPSPPPPYSRDETRFAFDLTPIPPEYVERNNSCLPPPFRSRNNTGEENSDKRIRHSSEKCERRNTWSGRRRRHASHDNGVLTSRLRRNTGEMMSGNVNPLALEVTNLDEQENLLPITIEK
ncbi:unnamed protein product [Dimorphilus gyrociliatus]|uniref:Uncharacterized protein n=1 Tax=Dimorphilus gyrociliatus TaxID=2664684 RepID=A0A7I8VJK7_9ANNE|nr:unnamed protein product [Dimorphilus gyrociliatus]